MKTLAQIARELEALKAQVEELKQRVPVDDASGNIYRFAPEASNCSRCGEKHIGPCRLRSAF